MKLHRNAALSWRGRRQLARRVVEQGSTLKAAAEAAGVSVRCARKWVGRYRLEGERGLLDRSSAPRRVANRTPSDRVEAIVALRGLRMTAAEIADTLEMALSTVSGILHRLGLGRLGRLGLEPPLRYERSRPGELVHIDVKQLGRIEGGAGKRMTGGIKRNPDRRALDGAGIERKTIGWEYVHVAIDDHSRLAYGELLESEDKSACSAFLRRAAAWYAEQGIVVERVLSDNAKSYHSHLWAATCAELGIERRYTRPYSPWTNGKAEALIKTLLREWAYRFVYPTSAHRGRALSGFLRWYNRRRPHGSLGGRPPISRVSHLCGHYN